MNEAPTPPLSSEEIDHPYHLVHPSAWPILGAGGALLLACGMVVFLHGGSTLWLWLGLLSILIVMVGWWRDVIKESVVFQDHTPVVKIGLRYGMVLFIASEVMFFAAFFWAFYNASLFPKIVDPEIFPLAGVGQLLENAANLSGVWPPPGIEVIPAFDLPLTMTLILLLSGCTVTWSHHALLEGKKQEALVALGGTVLLGVLFLSFQAYEYGHAHFGFTEGIYPSTFFMATGFHGFHVLIGTIFLSVCWFRMRSGHLTAESHFGFEAAAWYWHFVDVVWLFLFVSIYWWGGTPA